MLGHDESSYRTSPPRVRFVRLPGTGSGASASALWDVLRYNGKLSAPNAPILNVSHHVGPTSGAVNNGEPTACE